MDDYDQKRQDDDEPNPEPGFDPWADPSPGDGEESSDEASGEAEQSDPWGDPAPDGEQVPMPDLEKKTPWFKRPVIIIPTVMAAFVAFGVIKGMMATDPPKVAQPKTTTFGSTTQQVDTTGVEVPQVAPQVVTPDQLAAQVAAAQTQPAAATAPSEAPSAPAGATAMPQAAPQMPSPTPAASVEVKAEPVPVATATPQPAASTGASSASADAAALAALQEENRRLKADLVAAKQASVDKASGAVAVAPDRGVTPTRKAPAKRYTARGKHAASADAEADAKVGDAKGSHDASDGVTLRGVVPGMAWVESGDKVFVVKPGDRLPGGATVQSINPDDSTVKTSRGHLTFR